MKILMVLHAPPFPPNAGFSKRLFNILREVAKRHEVTLLGLGSKKEEVDFIKLSGITCTSVEFFESRRSRTVKILKFLWLYFTWKSPAHRLFNPDLARRLRELCASEQFDLIHYSISLLGVYGTPGNYVHLADTQNVEYDNNYRSFKEAPFGMRKLFFFLDYILLRRHEVILGNLFAGLLATSERDRQMITKDVKTPVYVIPNGVDLDFFAPQKIAPEPHSIIFSGAMSYFPNHNGILFFLEQIFPLVQRKAPNAKVYVVGPDVPVEVQMKASDKIVVTGFVDDIRPYISRAQVSVIPLRIGGGTRIKAIESMAMMRPIVSTTLGCEGLNVVHRKHVLLADTPEDFASSIIELFDNEELRTRICEEAFAFTRNNYDWIAIGKTLESVYQSVTARNQLLAAKRVQSSENGNLHDLAI